MKKQMQTEALNERIHLLQMKQERELTNLKEQAHLVIESFKPINLIKSSFHEISTSPEIKNNIGNNLIGLVTGFLSRKVLMGTSRNPVKKILGSVLQFGITNIVTRHSDTIKATGEGILKQVLKFRKGTKNEFRENDSAY